MKTHLATALVPLTLAATLAVAPQPATAGSPHTVDPSTMTPALNPSFDPWTCLEAGNQITCTGVAVQVYHDELTDIECDGQRVYASGSQDARMVRWHDLEGRALKTELQTSFADRLTLSPTGDRDATTVVFSGHWHKHYTYPVPGDLDARVLAETGAMFRLQSAGDGILLRDTGTVTFVPGEEYETVAEAHGAHEVYQDSADIDAAICDALS